MNRNNRPHINRTEALQFLEDMDQLDSLVGILNMEIDRLSAKWEHLTESANVLYADLQEKCPRNAYRPELTD